VRRHGLYLRLYAPLLVRRFEGSAVHLATFRLLIPLESALRRARPVIYAHGLELREVLARGDAKERAGLAQALGRATAIIANSQPVARLAIEAGADPTRTVVVSPAIDKDRITPAGPDLRARWGVGTRPVILTLARLVPRKGQDLVMRALPEIAKAVPDVAYVVAGKGSDRDRLETLASSLGVRDRVVFAGFVPEAELGAAYRSADLYAMPCRESEDDVEGFGITYLEAGAAKKPVLGGRSGGAGEAVRDGETGFLVDPNDPRELASRAIELLRDEALRAQMGARGRARIETELDPTLMARAILARTEAEVDGGAGG
jgi:phosphatidylinositol alpha-1,6-mannosyltransferase